MKYRLDKYGNKISALGFGCMRLPQTAGIINKTEAEKQIMAAYRNGVNYFDTAYILRFIGKEQFEKILRKHGEDRILFASDSPWSDIKNDVDILRSFNLEKSVEDKIFYRNAMKLLGLK